MKKQFKPDEEDPIRIVLMDVEEQPIERPKYKQETSYSGKKRHTTMHQVLANAHNREILDVYNDSGTVHDFRMFKESLADVLPEHILIINISEVGYDQF